MKLIKKSLLCVFLLTLSLCIALTGCSARENARAEELSLILTEEEFAVLDQFPNLKKLDLTGTDCYEAILTYIESHPQVAVTYSISLGADAYPSDATELELKSGDFEYQQLMDNLKYLPGIQKITFPDKSLTPEQFDNLQAAYSHITLDYMMPILGVLYDPGTTELDLSAMQPDQVAEVASQLSRLADLTYVELTDSDGHSSLSPSDVKVLRDAAPGATFHYVFELFGQTVSTDDEVIVFDEVAIGNENEAKIREALDILSGCKQFKLDNCGVDTAVMASLREDYPDIRIDWRIHIDYYNICTDETVLRMHNILNNQNAADLKYCTNVQYVDICENPNLSDISFISAMPDLECLIASECPISDLSPLKDMKKLTWLELVRCSYDDISVLSGCESLKYLNISFTGAKDLIPLKDLPLTHFVALDIPIDEAARDTFRSAHEGCNTRFNGNYPYANGWRYNVDGIGFSEYYRELWQIFRYNDSTYFGSHKD